MVVNMDKSIKDLILIKIIIKLEHIK